jgi:signal transduction histidine kinase
VVGFWEGLWLAIDGWLRRHTLTHNGILLVLRDLAVAAFALDARGVRLDVDAAGRLPVRGDGDELARALSNLVSNGVRYTPAGGAVRITGVAQDGEVHVGVADECGGIPDDHLPQVFDVGWRGEPQRSPGEHAGLGLAIVRGVADSHAGTVSVRNAERGCVFELTLPGEAHPLGDRSRVGHPDR